MYTLDSRHIHIYTCTHQTLDIDIYRCTIRSHTTMHRRRVASDIAISRWKNICACAEKVPGTTKANPDAEGMEVQMEDDDDVEDGDEGVLKWMRLYGNGKPGQ